MRLLSEGGGTGHGRPGRRRGNIGGGIDRARGGDLGVVIAAQVAAAERAGYDGIWTIEVTHDPFLQLLLGADRSPALTLGPGDRGRARLSS